MTDDNLIIKNIAVYIQYLTFILSIIYYKKFKDYTFYKYFVLYLFNLVLLDILIGVLYPNGENNKILFNIYTFFEFNVFALIFYNLISKEKFLKLVKVFVIVFNSIYFLSFYFTSIEMYTVSIEGFFNSCLIILYFIELLNSNKVLSYKKLFPFWMSVGFLIFYLTSVPFFTLLYANLFDTRTMFPIIYYLTLLLHLSLIYGLVACKKMAT